MADTATVTTTASSAQGTPTAPSEVVKPEAASTQAPATPSTPTPKVETKDAATPKAEEAKEVPAAKPEEAKKVEGKAEGKKAEAPKEVAYDIKLAEGHVVMPEEVEAIKAFAKESGYSNDQANAVASFVDANRKALKAKVDGEWLEGCKNHAVYGKDNFPATCESIKRYLESNFPKVQKILDQSGYANNPDIFEMVAELANRSKPDSLISGKQAVSQDTRSPKEKIADHYNKQMGVTT